MYICDNGCGYSSKAFFGICPSCYSGMAEKDLNTNAKVYKRSENEDKNISFKINNVDKDLDSSNTVEKRTIFNSFNEVISSEGGFINKQVIAFGAEAGIGKSTLCSMLSDDESLYISTEESYSQVNKRFLRVNPDSRADILNTKDFDTICEAIRRSNKKLIIVDSLNNINNGLDSYVKQAQNASKLTDIAKENNKIMIIICQVTRSGEITGMSSLLHVVDTILYFERSPVSSDLILTSTKNRFGEIGEIAIFTHSENGLIEAQGLDLENGIGESVIKCQFGTKRVPVKIEALVTRSSMNSPYRQSYGVNRNRLQQIIAILDYNHNFNFRDKDVYVSVSNGLSINDTMSDLAIANSILSSIYGKNIEIDDLRGEISLNGSIKGNSKIKFIKELVDLYR